MARENIEVKVNLNTSLKSLLWPAYPSNDSSLMWADVGMKEGPFYYAPALRKILSGPFLKHEHANMGFWYPNDALRYFKLSVISRKQDALFLTSHKILQHPDCWFLSSWNNSYVPIYLDAQMSFRDIFKYVEARPCSDNSSMLPCCSRISSSILQLAITNVDGWHRTWHEQI